MAISLVAVGAKITAAITNAIINAVNANGQVSVIPTSVAGTGVSVGAAGKVTFAAATTVSVNGCFTSTYENYYIEMLIVHSTSTSTTMRLRAAGTDDSSANYDVQQLLASGATASAVQSLAGTSWFLAGVSSTQENESITVNAPALALATEAISTNRGTANPMVAGNGLAFKMMQHRSLTAFDGFTLTPSAGTITGYLRIYGWNNN